MHASRIINNLVYVQHFCVDNDVFIEFHSNFFYAKNNYTKRIIHQGLTNCSLLKILGDSLGSSKALKCVVEALIIESSLCHDRLCHVCIPIVNKVLAYTYNKES